MSIHVYLELDGIKGESSAKGQEDKIEIMSWSHGFSQPTSSARGSTGSTVERAYHSDISVTKYIDIASDGIIKAIWSGNQIATASISCFRSDGNEENAPIEYLKIDLDAVIISSYNISGGAGDLPVEHLSLNYGKVKYSYKIQLPKDGTVGGNLAISADLVTGTIS